MNGAREVCSPPPELRKADHTTAVFLPLYWLPVSQRIQGKLNILCYNCITRGIAPSYLRDRLQLYTPSRTLRSASDALGLLIPCSRLSTVGSRAFSVFGPSTWNDLPLPLRQKLSIGFKSNLKTFLFPNLYTCHVFCSARLRLFRVSRAFAARLKLCIFSFV